MGLTKEATEEATKEPMEEATEVVEMAAETVAIRIQDLRHRQHLHRLPQNQQMLSLRLHRPRQRLRSLRARWRRRLLSTR